MVFMMHMLEKTVSVTVHLLSKLFYIAFFHEATWSCSLQFYRQWFAVIMTNKEFTPTVHFDMEKKLVTRLPNFPDRRIRYEFYLKKNHHKQRNKFLEFN